MKELDFNRIKLAQLRALIAVVEAGNFSEAALNLGLSQSAVSHAIATLERTLGVILLVRNHQGAYPTPIGARVTEQAQQILQQMAVLLQTVNLEKGLQGGQVRVACFRSVATHLLPGMIMRFRDRFPDITVTVIEHGDHQRVENTLRAGLADIGFINLPATEEFETWEILQDEYLALLPPNPVLSDRQITWKQLQAYPLIFPSEAGICYRLVSEHLQRCNIPIQIAYDVQESSTMVSLVSQGLGAAILARLSAQPIPSDVQTFSLPVPLKRVIGAAVLAKALQPPAVFAFLEMIRGQEGVNGKRKKR